MLAFGGMGTNCQTDLLVRVSNGVTLGDREAEEPIKRSEILIDKGGVSTKEVGIP